MGEESNTALTIPRSSAASSLSLRFLGLLKQPDDSDLDPNPTLSSALELDESDVVWSSSSDHSSPCSVSSPVTTSPASFRRTSRAFVPGTFGLSALLESTSPGPSPGPVRRQSSPVTPPVSVPITRQSPTSRKAYNQSAPVAVPVWPGRRREGRKGRGEVGDGMWVFDEEEEIMMDGIGEDDMEEMVPPHVIDAQRTGFASGSQRRLAENWVFRFVRQIRNSNSARVFFVLLSLVHDFEIFVPLVFVFAFPIYLLVLILGFWHIEAKLGEIFGLEFWGLHCCCRS
ncbi:hypothetical protein LUZ63_001976 [Rhynchospora breviuscula]|uniref:Uncharacterized protein n=1 Tax=Rhynchospora breviuscula TaxID=2022672 RepID=A0A9Q0CXV6_9POAL|nr:hypothetical protein LUZ63_001976 [Rhynchospora breviuscula]